MIYADTDFFLALMKETDWLKTSARALLEKHKGEIWTSPITFIELLLLSDEFGLDPERLVVDVMELAQLRGGDANVYLVAAHYMEDKGIHVFDALHAAFCGPDCEIISSDKVFDKLGFKRILLEP